MRVLERGLIATALGASLAALLFVAFNGLAPTPTRLTLALVLWAGFLALYASFAAPGVAVLALLSRAPRLAPGIGWLLRGLSGGLLATALATNAAAVPVLAALSGPLRFRLLTPAAFALCALGLALAALLGLERRAALRWIAALAVVATLAAFYPLRPGPGPALPQVRPTPPLLVVGLDGADWRYIEPLLARHELPHLAALRAAGAWGPLATLQPTLSPVVWTTMATGRLPQDHGVDGFLMTTLRPVDVALPSVLRMPRGVGAAALVARLKDRELWREGPVGSEARRVPALWNLATAYGAPMVVVHWWATSNPEPIQGALISSRPYYAATEGAPDVPGDEAAGAVFPSRLYPELLRRVVKPADIPFAQARGFVGVKEADWAKYVQLPLRHDGHLLQMLPYTLSLHETTREVARYALERTRSEAGRPVDLMVLFRLVDMICHKGLVDSDLIQRAPGEADTIFTPAVAEAYRTVDRALGELVEAMPDANVLVVSDHGFDVFEGRKGRRAHHERAPDGIFIGAGPAFRPGRVEGLGVLDVMPLLLNLKGMAQARNLAGHLPDRVLAPDWLALRVPDPVASYDGVKRGARASVRGGVRSDEAEMEGLRALGYIN